MLLNQFFKQQPFKKRLDQNDTFGKSIAKTHNLFIKNVVFKSVVLVQSATLEPFFKRLCVFGSTFLRKRLCNI